MESASSLYHDCVCPVHISKALYTLNPKSFSKVFHKSSLCSFDSSTDEAAGSNRVLFTWEWQAEIIRKRGAFVNLYSLRILYYLFISYCWSTNAAGMSLRAFLQGSARILRTSMGFLRSTTLLYYHGLTMILHQQLSCGFTSTWMYCVSTITPAMPTCCSGIVLCLSQGFGQQRMMPLVVFSHIRINLTSLCTI